MSTAIVHVPYSILQSHQARPVAWIGHRSHRTKTHATRDGNTTLCSQPIPSDTLHLATDADVTCRKCARVLHTHLKYTTGLFVCRRCKEPKPHSEFWRVNRHSGVVAHISICRTCMTEIRARFKKWLAKR